MIEHFEVIIVGGGQAGLALGYYLAQRGLSFVILEQAARVGETWRSRYDSLRLFTPSAYNSLPGLPFPKPDHEYPTKDDVADYLERYIQAFQLPLRFNSRVCLIEHRQSGFLVQTNTASYQADQVVVATSGFRRPYVPPIAAGLAPEVFQIHSAQYRNPSQIPPGAVLVVGAGNSGVQIAEELAQTRQVYVSVGKQLPALKPQIFGKSQFWWLYKLGYMSAPITSMAGQILIRTDWLIGTSIKELARQHELTLVGRTKQAQGNTLTFRNGQTLQVSNIVWATGYRPDYSLIKAQICNKHGKLMQRRGVTAVRGLYFLGLPWLYRADSGLLGGVGRDAGFIADQIASNPVLAST